MTCTRSWQAEAIEDGRLSGPDLASFDRHRETCAECTREVAELARLRTALGKLPAATTTPLVRRRLRSHVLRRADAARLGAPNRWRMVLFALAALAGALVIALVLRPRSRPTPPAPVAVVPIYDVEPAPLAEWRTEEQGPVVRQRVVRGRVAFHVAKLAHGQRFLLALPDGELEVKGTRFVVDVGESGTTAVSCSEGQVVLRLAGRDEITLGAGEAWPAPPSIAASVVPSVAPAPPRNVPPKTAGAEFVEAMAAFTDGDLARAERLLLAFERHHPNDSRAEDAAFLRALARSRRGDAPGARLLAREYLERYPSGLRKTEAEQLAR